MSENQKTSTKLVAIANSLATYIKTKHNNLPFIGGRRVTVN